MSAEYRAFIQLFGDLHTGIREGLDPLVQEAFAKGLISEGVYHGANDTTSSSVDARTRKFLNGVKDRVRLDRTAFDDFADLLFAQTGMEFLGDRLMKCKCLPSPPEQETISRDYESIVRSGPARPVCTRRCYSPPADLQRRTFDVFSNLYKFSLQFNKGERKDWLAVAEPKQSLMSPPPKAVATVISTSKVDKSPDSIESPTIGKNNVTITLRAQRSTSLERMSVLTPVKAELPQLMKTTPTPTTSPPAYSNPGPVKSSPKPHDNDQPSEIDENDETLELPTDDLRPRFSTSSSVESSLEYFTPMSTPLVSIDSEQPPSFCPSTLVDCNGTNSVDPVQESQPTSEAAISITAASTSIGDTPQTELATPSPSVCPHFQQSMELAVQVKMLEKDLQGCFQREQEVFARHTSELQQLSQENYTLKQHNEHYQKNGEILSAQVDDLDRKVQAQRFELHDLKRELETHQAKAKGFDYVVKSDKLEQQLHEAHELLSAMQQHNYNNSTGNAYGPV